MQGRHELLERVGVTPVSETHRARDAAGKTVAVRRLLRPCPEATLKNLIERLAQPPHPDVARVLGGTAGGDAQEWSRDWLPGITLRDWLERLRGKKVKYLPAPAAVRLALELLDVLHLIHTALDPSGAPAMLVHGHLVAGNVVVLEDGAVKLLDVGVVRLFEAAADGAKSAYPERELAPEQVRGEAADPLTDVHAVGALLYELTTGRRPHEKAGEPLMPPTAWNRQLPPILAALIGRALSPERADRYPSAAAFREDLATIAEAGLLLKDGAFQALFTWSLGTAEPPPAVAELLARWEVIDVPPPADAPRRTGEFKAVAARSQTGELKAVAQAAASPRKTGEFKAVAARSQTGELKAVAQAAAPPRKTGEFKAVAEAAAAPRKTGEFKAATAGVTGPRKTGEFKAATAGVTGPRKTGEFKAATAGVTGPRKTGEFKATSVRAQTPKDVQSVIVSGEATTDELPAFVARAPRGAPVEVTTEEPSVVVSSGATGPSGAPTDEPSSFARAARARPGDDDETELERSPLRRRVAPRDDQETTEDALSRVVTDDNPLPVAFGGDDDEEQKTSIKPRARRPDASTGPMPAASSSAAVTAPMPAEAGSRARAELGPALGDEDGPPTRSAVIGNILDSNASRRSLLLGLGAVLLVGGVLFGVARTVLASATAVVEVATTPVGADVLVNGELMEGVTPLKLLLPAKKPHLIQVQLAGRQPWSQTVTPTEEAPTFLRVDLRPHGGR